VRKTDEAVRLLEGRAEREVPLSDRAQGRKDTRPPERKKLHPARAARLATLHFAGQRVELQRSKHVPDHWPETLSVNVVRVWEPEPPEGEEPIEWFLETTEPINTLEQLLFVVDSYRARWLIEEFFKALKTGCTVEKLQSEMPERLLELIGLYAPIAVNLLALRTLAQHAPEAPAEQVMTKVQLQLLGEARNHGLMKPRHAPTPPRTAEEALWLVARLGGHLGKRGEAGWQVLMRGMLTLHEQAVGFVLGTTFVGPLASTKTVLS
jgi:hypothetical protein